MQTGITQTTFRIVIAMNRLGGKSNTGEGGGDADRYTDDIQSSFRVFCSPLSGLVCSISNHKKMLDSSLGCCCNRIKHYQLSHPFPY